MKVLPYLKLFILIYCMVLTQSFAATSLKLEVMDNGHGKADSQKVFAGVPFEVAISVTEGDRNTGTVELEKTDKISIVGTSRSTNISMFNGKFTSQTTYLYQLIAPQEGTIKLGPARVKQGDQTIESNVLELTVAPASEQSKEQNSNQPGSSAGQSHVTQEQKNQDDQQSTVLCRLTTNKKSIVVGEPITAKIIILSHGPIAQIAIEPPKFPGFMVKEIQKISRRQETHKNQLYDILEKKYILTPSESGQKTIEPIKVAYAIPLKHRPRHHRLFDDVFAGFFDQDRLEQKATTSNPLHIIVDQLPDSKKQIDGVGDFTSFDASISKREAHVNEALTFKLEITGMGNLDQIPTPKLVLPAFIKAYDSKATVQEDLNNDYHGSKKTFEYVIQIAQEGDAEIPSQQFTYFDTATKTVKTLKTAALSVHLTPSPKTQQPRIKSTATESEEAPTPQPTPKAHPKDINFIQEDGPISHRPSTGINPLLLLILILVIPAIIFTHRMIKSIASKALPHITRGRSRKKYFDRLSKEFDSLSRNNQVDKLYQFFIKFLATKYGANAEAITHDVLYDYLSKNQWAEEKINDFFDFLNECAGYRFISQTTSKKNDFEGIFKKGSYWLLLLTNEKGS